MGHGLIKKELVLVKIESSYGTDPTPTGSANALIVRNVSVSPAGLRMNERPAINGQLGQLAHVYGGSLKQIEFEVELVGSGAAGTPPRFGPLLQACGLGYTNSASTSDTYKPADGSHGSATIYYYEQASGGSTSLLHKLTGCRGNASINCEAGGIPVISFTMTGHSATPTTETTATPTFSQPAPTALKDLAVTVGSVEGVVQSFSLDFGNEIVTPDDMNVADGYGEIIIAGRDPVIELTRHQELIATISPWGDMAAGTTRAFATGDIGAAGKIVSISAPAMSYRNVGPADSNGIRQIVSTFGLAASSGADDFTILFK